MSETKFLKRKPVNDVNLLRRELLDGTDTVKFCMNVPRKLHREFKKKAFLAEVDMKDILLYAIKNYVSGNHR